ncbi:MAG: hypothetical protein QOI32_1062, partial [Thermoleophilaceae bacterium]|nr:hypothetical protein [Thermoleophilaceae bacterium]
MSNPLSLVRTEGGFLFSSGQVGIDSDTGWRPADSLRRWAWRSRISTVSYAR